MNPTTNVTPHFCVFALQAKAAASTVQLQQSKLQRIERDQIQFYHNRVVRQLQKEVAAWALRDEVEPQERLERRRDGGRQRQWVPPVRDVQAEPRMNRAPRQRLFADPE